MKIDDVRLKRCTFVVNHLIAQFVLYVSLILKAGEEARSTYMHVFVHIRREVWKLQGMRVRIIASQPGKGG